MQLILDLERLPNDSDSQDSQRYLLEKMVKNANSRMNEFRQLQALYNVLAKTDLNSAAEIQDQMTHLEMINNSLKSSREKMAINKNINTGNLRMSEISTYYSDKYRAFSGVVLYVIYFCIPILLLTILRSRGFISLNIMSMLITIIIVIGGFIILPKIQDIKARNNMVFSEYDFSTMRNLDWESELGENEDIDGSGGNVECVGPECCTAGMKYDNDRERCVVKEPTCESFLSGQHNELIGSEL